MSRIVLQPLTRVEGHGRVELLLQDGRLQQARVALIESPRLFEKLVIGRSVAEVPDLICRICAICSAVHKVTALTALERALGIEVPPAALMVRELLLLGGHIQSHALHLFCLILPDFTDQPGVLELVRQGDPLAESGLALKAFGNRLQENTGGRVIHPVNAVLGGVVRSPPAADLAGLQSACDDWLARWPRLAADFAGTARYPRARPVVGTALATGGNGRFALTGEQLHLAGTAPVPLAGYAGLLGERIVPYSRARQSLGRRAPFLVGALARRRLHAGEDGQRAAPESAAGIHDNNQAQLEEIGWALERVGELLAELQRLPEDTPLAATAAARRGGVGTAAFEAPRGLLIHHYVVDDWGQVAVADIVTPTAINQLVMERQLLEDLGEVDDETELRRSAERIVRAYDPCISCAVHLIQR